MRLSMHLFMQAGSLAKLIGCLGAERGTCAYHALVSAGQHAPIGGRCAQRHGGVQHLGSKLRICDGHLLLEVRVLQAQQPLSGAAVMCGPVQLDDKQYTLKQLHSAQREMWHSSEASPGRLGDQPAGEAQRWPVRDAQRAGGPQPTLAGLPVLRVCRASQAHGGGVGPAWASCSGWAACC